MSSYSATGGVRPSRAHSHANSYGWVIVVLSAFVMLSTLPGRTQGLGLITEPLLKDLKVDRVAFANINLWATLLGALFCLPVGWAIDRLGLRLVTVLMLLATGASAYVLSFQTGAFWPLLFIVTLTRGFGQSALSVCSITSVGKWFPNRSGNAMGAFAFLMGFLFAIAFLVIGGAVISHGWRAAWSAVGMMLIFIIAPLALILLKNPPDDAQPAPVEESEEELFKESDASLSLIEAVRTPAFWVFAGATALFGLVSSGLGLFQQAVLEERGFNQETYHILLAVTTLLSLLAQLGAGWLSLRYSMGTLTAVAMLLYAIALMLLPSVSSNTQLWCFAALMGVAAGIIIVIFFAVWGQLFGRAHLGRIQAAAQTLTVLASAIGPLLFAECHERYGSYSPILLAMAPLVLIIGVAAWRVPNPQPSPSQRVA